MTSKRAAVNFLGGRRWQPLFSSVSKHPWLYNAASIPSPMARMLSRVPSMWPTARFNVSYGAGFFVNLLKMAKIGRPGNTVRFQVYVRLAYWVSKISRPFVAWMGRAILGYNLANTAT